MLNVMRENLRHLKWVLWIVAFSMVLYLGYYFGGSRGGSRGVDADWAAKVDGSSISTRRFLEQARRADEYYRKVLGAQYEQLKSQLQLGRQVVQGLVDQEIMLREAKALGLSASPADVSRRIYADPQFRDASGQFVGKEKYSRAMDRAYPGGVAAFERNLAEEIAAQKWRNLVTEAVAVTDREVEDLYRSRADRAALEYVLVPSANQDSSLKATDAEKRAWYDAHRDSYRRGEGRRVRYVVIERQAQMAKAKATDQEIQAYYESNRAEFNRPEQRRARHILFRVDAGAPPAVRDEARGKAEATLERLRKGEDFATLAKTLSQDPGSAAQGGDLGFFGRGAMVPSFEKAAFETPPGQLAPVVETEFGYHVLQVTESRAGGTVPLEEAKDAIRRQLEVRRAQDLVQAEAQRIRATMQSAAELEAVARREGLKVEEAVVSRGERSGDLGASPEFTDAVFRLDRGSLTPPLAIARGMAIAEVLETVPPSVRPFAEVQERVLSDLLNARLKEAALAKARRALASSPDLQAAAKALGEEVRNAEEYAPGKGLPGVGREAELEKAVFAPGTGAGTRGVVPVAAGAILYRVVKRDTFDRSRLEAMKPELRAELLNQRRAALLESVIDAARQRHKIEINQELVDRVLG